MLLLSMVGLVLALVVVLVLALSVSIRGKGGEFRIAAYEAC